MTKRFLIEEKEENNNVWIRVIDADTNETLDSRMVGDLLNNFHEELLKQSEGMGMLIEENNKMEKREQELLAEIQDFQNLLNENDTVCYEQVLKIIDLKLEENEPLQLSEKWDVDCQYIHSCRENHERNTASASRYWILKELRKEFEL